MKILIDMNLSPHWCRVLAEHGHQTVHWSQVGDPRAADSAIMDWARERSHVVLTHDLDFGAILATTRASGPSVIQVRAQDILPTTMEKLLTDALSAHEGQLLSGALVVVDAARSRARVLPLSR